LDQTGPRRLWAHLPITGPITPASLAFLVGACLSVVTNRAGQGRAARAV